MHEIRTFVGQEYTGIKEVFATTVGHIAQKRRYRFLLHDVLRKVIAQSQQR